MFFHNFKYTMEILFKNKSLVFWTYAFPIIMGTLFYFAFSNIENSEKLGVIDIAIVENEEFKSNDIMSSVFKELSKENDDKLFNIKYVDINKANDLLDKKEISGYLEIIDGKSNIVIKSSGINETVFKSVVDEINEKENIVKSLIPLEVEKNYKLGNTDINYEQITNDIIEKINVENNNYKDESSSKLSYVVIEFYTLIAMTCLYSGSIGMYTINNTLANMSSKGKRIAVSAISKIKLLLSSICASFVVQLIGLIILFIYTAGILKVDYGNNLFGIVLLSLMGTVAGLSFGMMVASAFKVSENSKIGIIISSTMFFSFLSGMMGISTKYVIDKHFPIVNKLNPANMITDGFYSLYYYSTLDRFYMNIISLAVFSLIMIFISFIFLRRQKYASI